MKVVYACVLVLAVASAQRTRKLFNNGTDELVPVFQPLFDPSEGLMPYTWGDMYGDVLSIGGVGVVVQQLSRSGDVYLEEDAYNTLFDGQFTVDRVVVRSNTTTYKTDSGVLRAQAPVTIDITKAVFHVYVDTHHRTKQTCTTDWLALHLDQVDSLVVSSDDPRFNVAGTSEDTELYLSYFNKFLSFSHNRAVFNKLVDLCWLVV